MIRISGSDIRPRAMATICCSPPDSVPASWRRRSASRGNSVKTLSRRSAYLLAARLEKAPISRFSATLMEENNCRPSGTSAKPRAALAWARQPRHVLAFEHDLAAPRRDRARDRAQRRGLAGAVGADDGGELAAPGRERQAPQHLDLAVAGLEVLDCEQRLGLRMPAGCIGLAASGMPRLRAVVRRASDRRDRPR